MNEIPSDRPWNPSELAELEEPLVGLLPKSRGEMTIEELRAFVDDQNILRGNYQVFASRARGGGKKSEPQPKAKTEDFI